MTAATRDRENARAYDLQAACTLPDMTNYLAVDDCEPAVLFLLHVTERCRNFFKFCFGAVVAIQNSLLVIALDCSIRPQTAPLNSY